MITDTQNLTSIEGPFSTISGLTWPEYDGFMVTPSLTGNVGYGFPIYPDNDTSKPRIFPGTYGSADGTATMLIKAKGVWKEKKLRTHQDFGSTDWWGPKKTSKTNSPRVVISHHGPKSRVFPDGFQYGSSSRHKEVYMDGGIIGIAPGPVTGACLRAIPQEDNLYGTYKYRLVVICIVAGTEEVHIRPCGSPVYRSKMTEAKEKSLTRTATTEDPVGWSKLGSAGVSGYDTPTSPWIFNKSGTEAQCVRLKDFTFDPSGGADGQITQKIGHRFKMVVTDNVATTTNLQNDPPFQFTEKGKKLFKGLWTPTEKDVYDYPHTWEELYINSYGEMKGKQIVAVDYVDDQEAIIRIEIDTKQGHHKDFMKGMDTYSGNMPENGLPYMTNAGWYRNLITNYQTTKTSLGSPEVSAPEDHRASLWFTKNWETLLSYTVGSTTKYAVLESQYGTRNNDIENILLHSYTDQCYVRFLDVRAELMFVSMDRSDWDTLATMLYNKKNESYVTDMASKGSTSYSYFADSGPASMLPATEVVRAPLRFDNGTDYDTAKALPDGEWTWSYTTYTGERPTSNDDNSKGKYNSRWQILTFESLAYAGYKGLGTVRHNRYTQACGVAVTPDFTVIANYYIQDPAAGAGTLKVFTVHSEGIDPVSLAGGQHLYPLGII